MIRSSCVVLEPCPPIRRSPNRNRSIWHRASGTVGRFGLADSTRCSQLRTPRKQNLPFLPTNQRGVVLQTGPPRGAAAGTTSSAARKNHRASQRSARVPNVSKRSSSTKAPVRLISSTKPIRPLAGQTAAPLAAPRNSDFQLARYGQPERSQLVQADHAPNHEQAISDIPSRALSFVQTFPNF